MRGDHSARGVNGPSEALMHFPVSSKNFNKKHSYRRDQATQPFSIRHLLLNLQCLNSRLIHVAGAEDFIGRSKAARDGAVDLDALQRPALPARPGSKTRSIFRSGSTRPAGTVSCCSGLQHGNICRSVTPRLQRVACLPGLRPASLHQRSQAAVRAELDRPGAPCTLDR